MTPRTARVEARARTRQALIDAGLRLAEHTSLSGLSINRLVEAAHVAKGTFFHHFGDRAAYLLALHRDFHDRIVAEILSAVDAQVPGTGRLLVATRTYLDACLRERGVRAVLLEARAEPVITAEVRLRNASSASMFEADFRAMRWRRPHESAQLWVGMVAEAALIELDEGREILGVRDALARFVNEPPH